MNALLLLAPLSLFLETGLPIGLFVPGGDTLLLALGALAAEGGLEAFPLLPLLFLGSFLGHLLGYALGQHLPLWAILLGLLLLGGIGLLLSRRPYSAG